MGFSLLLSARIRRGHSDGDGRVSPSLFPPPPCEHVACDAEESCPLIFSPSGGSAPRPFFFSPSCRVVESPPLVVTDLFSPFSSSQR